MKKKIFLIGLNLYSIFLSLRLKSSFKNSEIIILEGSKNFLNAYKKLKIGKYFVNPGFHALEDIRSQNLLKTLNKTIKFKKIKKTRGMIIGNKLISYQDQFVNWPDSLIKKFKLSKKIFVLDPKKNLNLLDKKYLKYLKANFSDNRTSFDDTVNLSYPWFFTPNYKIKSNDEAAIFNEKVRKGELRHKYVFPKKGLFSEISKGLKKLLKIKNIEIKLQQPLLFSKNKNKILFHGYNELNEVNNVKVVCIPVKPLSMSIIGGRYKKTKLQPIKYFTGLIEVKNYIKSDLDRFTEIITSSEYAPGLKRISLYSEIFGINNKKIYQFEFLEHNNEKDLLIQTNKILNLLSKFIKFKNNKKEKNLKLIGFTFVRNAFRPKKKIMNNITNYTNNFFKDNKNVFFPRKITWPINSNKHFIYANEDYKKIIKQIK